jgi:HEPN domain-containing protein
VPIYKSSPPSEFEKPKFSFKAGEYSGAYYLAGYAVECALKACFAKGVKRYDFPDKDRAGKIFTHKLAELARLAKLDTDLAAATKANSKLDGS